MLMCGGIDRYFQIARCYRDETSRPDRQPEFTQLDIEMANTTMDGVLELVEDVLQYSWPTNLLPIPRKFDRMSYKDAMENYGSDQPDVRFEHKITNITDVLEPSLNLYGQGDAFYAGCLIFDNAKHQIKLSKNYIANSAKDYPNTRMMHFKCENYEEFTKHMSKTIKDDVVIRKLYEKLNLKGISSVILVYGNKNMAVGYIFIYCDRKITSETLFSVKTSWKT